MPVRVLLVEDDATIRTATRIALERDGFEVRTAADGPAGLAEFRLWRPDIALLDVMLPGLDGVSVCREIRVTDVTAVVMLSARGDAVDVVLGLEAGADDYVVKPFDVPVLAARLRAVLRRVRRPAGRVLRVGALEIDVDGAEVRRDGERIALTATELRLLADLVEHAGIVRRRDELLGSVWGYGWSGDTRLVDVHVQRLRAKVGAEIVQTVRGVGYKVPR
jgi:DNA-binding response OmpR family regulator